MPFTSVIGVDCATKPKRVGVARAHRAGGSWRLVEARSSSDAELPADLVSGWIAEDRNALLALDAPLGWPVELPRALHDHRAGDPIDAEAATLFHRTTDRFVYETLGQRPLEVGADRIARTALAALDMLQRVRDQVEDPIPLAWSAGAASRHSGTPPAGTLLAGTPRADENLAEPRPAAIEVYPAATLKAHGLVGRGYKGAKAHVARRSIQALIEARLVDDVGFEPANVVHDVLDAVLCVIAGLDFLDDTCYPPTDRVTAEHEGWIWVKRK